MTVESSATLVRAIGRWSLAALVINSIIGSGVFGLPSVLAGLLGTASPYAVLLGALGIGIIMACFAEVGSQFRDPGGPYIYAQATFGRFAGLEVGWLTWLVRLTASAANANLFVNYFAEFWPAVSSPAPRLAMLTAIIGLLAYVNYRGVRSGTTTSNFFTAAKLIPLLIFICLGLVFLAGSSSPQPSEPAQVDWLKSVLLLVFAYGGFEAALMPTGEVKNPRRDTPFALFTALITVTVVYVLVQVVVVGTLADPNSTNRPLATAAHVFIGSGGAAFITIGALISVFGYISAAMLNVPRLTFAFAERKDFPKAFSLIHPKFRTPHVSIAAFALLVWALAVIGSFEWNASISAAARLLTYGTVCAAVLKLRKDKPDADAFRLPVGRSIAVLGIFVSLFPVSTMGMTELIVILLTTAIALSHWFVVRKIR
ncbi:MAG: amino acid permease [Ignavibacteria bacterium]|nr:amino acid permease [Ignavibacteria bacterium]